jgi:cytochrome c biogenesis protein CcmG, thiol:disulfide interchange protein DsbE
LKSPLLLSLASAVALCSYAAKGAERTELTPSGVISRVGDALRRSDHSFRLVESQGGERIRIGRLTVYPSSARPIVDLRWISEERPTRMTSDGQTVFVQGPDGRIQYSPWNEAGSVLYQQVAGHLLGAAVDPSSFGRYGASLTQPEGGTILQLHTGLPSGGGWDLLVSAQSWMPEEVRFRASADGETESLHLEPIEEPPAAPRAELTLQAEGGEPAERFYAGPAPGALAPDVEFELEDSRRLSIGALRGRVLVLDFWATWCMPCRRAMQELETLYQREHDDGLEVLGFRLWDSGDGSAFLEGLGVTYPTGDGAPLAEPYGVNAYGLPTLYVIDRGGKIVSLIVGYSEGDDEKLERVVGDSLRAVRRGPS